MTTIDDDPVLERVTAPSCAVAGCTGRATEGRVCMFHQYAPGGPVPTPLAVVRPRPHGAKKARRSFTDEQKRTIAREYAEAPSGTAKTVLARHAVVSSLVIGWCKQFGFDTRSRAQRTVDEAPPEPVEPAVPSDIVNELEQADDEPTGVSAEAIVDALTDEVGVWLTFDQDELDVLDACAFLEDTDRFGLVAGLITEWITLHADDGDVKLCLAARRGHRDEITAG